jgi:oligopeptide transport system ATP-binding protein
VQHQREQQALLAVRDVFKTFSLGRAFTRRAVRLVALDGVDVDLRHGEILGVVGESGSGKSTLARVIVRLEHPDSGRVLLHGRDLSTMRGKELTAARRKLQLVYQDPYSSLNPRLSAIKTVVEPARVHRVVASGTEESFAKDLLSRVGLPTRMADYRPRMMSGGQRQRLAIARALATRPEALIADEPVSALDVSIQTQILNLFLQLRSDLDLAMIFIGHQLSVVSEVADRVAVMYLGRIVESGPIKDVFRAHAHPYTVALLKAQPGRHRRSAVKPAIQGEIPSGIDIPSGCRFRNRCPLAEPICAEVDPPPVIVSAGHWSRCHVLPGRAA